MDAIVQHKKEVCERERWNLFSIYSNFVLAMVKIYFHEINYVYCIVCNRVAGVC